MKNALFRYEVVLFAALPHIDNFFYKQAHIWDYFDKRKNGLLDSLSYKSLEESSLHMDQDVSI